MVWKVPRLWNEGECWIIGGGPSLPKEFGVPEETIAAVRKRELPPSVYSPYMSAIHGKHVIGINSAFLIGNWIDIVFFGDRGWFFNNRKELADFPGIKVTCHGTLNKTEYHKEKIKFVGKDRNHSKGITPRHNMVSWNMNSGAAAISLAVHLGVKRIILLGFDMSLDEEMRQHWHSLYGTAGARADPVRLPFHRHLRGFPVIEKDAKKMGVKIINASPRSAIMCFDKRSVKDILSGGKV